VGGAAGLASDQSGAKLREAQATVIVRWELALAGCSVMMTQASSGNRGAAAIINAAWLALRGIILRR
jgi:hypothetical protein